MSDTLLPQQPDQTAGCETKKISLKQDFIELGAETGHNQWLRHQTPQRFPHPERGYELRNGNSVGHPMVMQYSTMQAVKNSLAEGAEPMTPDRFIHMLRNDFPQHADEFGYINEINRDMFNQWMHSIGTEYIHSNDNWGKIAYALLESQNIDPGELVAGNCTPETQKLLLDLYRAVPKISPLKDARKLESVLNDNPILKESMVLAHGFWRSMRYPDQSQNNLHIPGLMDDIETRKKREPFEQVNTFVQDVVLKNLYSNATVSAQQSFEAMIRIAHIFRDSPSFYHKDYSKYPEAAEEMVQMITYDANLAVPLTLLQIADIDVDG